MREDRKGCGEMGGEVNPAACPLCGKHNQCGNLSEQRIGDCWCRIEAFPAGLLEQVPSAYKNKACICKSCLDRYKRGNLPG
ncbi:cysteine-rich CWC family protein [Laceyella sediminis]|nr:cysteine-rich CWC family protein [Laceyella sediminis]